MAVPTQPILKHTAVISGTIEELERKADDLSATDENFLEALSELSLGEKMNGERLSERAGYSYSGRSKE